MEQNNNTLKFKCRPPVERIIFFLILGMLYYKIGKGLHDDLASIQSYIILGSVVLLIIGSLAKRSVFLGLDHIQFPDGLLRKDVNLKFKDIHYYNVFGAGYFYYDYILWIACGNKKYSLSIFHLYPADRDTFLSEFKKRVPLTEIHKKEVIKTGAQRSIFLFISALLLLTIFAAVLLMN